MAFQKKTFVNKTRFVLFSVFFFRDNVLVQEARHVYHNLLNNYSLRSQKLEALEMFS